MKNYCTIVYIIFLILIKLAYNLNLMTKNQMTKTELDELIEYLAEETSDEEQSLLETNSKTFERGMGCEAMSYCSGKGSCKNGACLCDEGYDYFDCSVNVLSKLHLI
jgi:hypothetical protein